MDVFHHLNDLDQVKGCSVAIGNFDGVHLGHQALLGRALEHQSSKVPCGVLTFFPHPVEVLKPGVKLQRLTTTDEKLGLLESLGFDFVFVAPFTVELAALSPEEFFRTFLGEGLSASEVTVGFNFYFGKNKSGNIETLLMLCKQHHVALHISDAHLNQGVVVSSSSIRSALSRGEVELAQSLLGRAYGVGGKVVRGDGRGKALGFPTANLEVPLEKAIPKVGVYYCQAKWQKQTFGALVNVGYQPTFKAESTPDLSPRIEAHLLGLDASLYDERLEIEFLGRIRDEKKFATPGELSRQIQKDMQVAEKWMKNGRLA